MIHKLGSVSCVTCFLLGFPFVIIKRKLSIEEDRHISLEDMGCA